MEATQEQLAELVRLRAYRPFMLVFGALSPEGEWRTKFASTKHWANSLVRKGWKVYEVKE